MAKGEYNDYFDEDSNSSPAEEQEPQKEETAEEIDAREIEGQTIGKRNGSKLRRAIAALVAVAAAVVAVWIAVVFWLPYVTEARKRGAIVDMRQEGLIFKTFEGLMVTDERLADTIHVYERDFLFSVEDDSVARDLMELQSTGRRVTLTYKEYRGTLPWRGNSKKIVTGYKVE